MLLCCVSVFSISQERIVVAMRVFVCLTPDSREFLVLQEERINERLMGERVRERERKKQEMNLGN